MPDTRIEYFEVPAADVFRYFRKGLTLSNPAETIASGGETFYDPTRGVFIFKVAVVPKEPE